MDENRIDEKTVYIGTERYRISLVPQWALTNEGTDLVGRYNYSSGSIRILDTLDEDRREQVLWHEVIHIICMQRNVQLTEEQLDALAYGLYALTTVPVED